MARVLGGITILVGVLVCVHVCWRVAARPEVRAATGALATDSSEVTRQRREVENNITEVPIESSTTVKVEGKEKGKGKGKGKGKEKDKDKKNSKKGKKKESSESSEQSESSGSSGSSGSSESDDEGQTETTTKSVDENVAAESLSEVDNGSFFDELSSPLVAEDSTNTEHTKACRGRGRGPNDGNNTTDTTGEEADMIGRYKQGKRRDRKSKGNGRNSTSDDTETSLYPLF